MLYIKVQSIKESMNIVGFQKETGGRSACPKRIMKAKKWCGELSSNDTFFSDTRFSGIKTVEDINVEGLYYCRPVKTSCTAFCLSMLVKAMKYCRPSINI